MSVLSFCLGGLRRRTPAARNADVSRNACTGARDAAAERELPLSFSELIAASAFLDFGGMLDERRLSGREPEKTGTDRHWEMTHDRRPSASEFPPGNGVLQSDTGREECRCLQWRREHDVQQFTFWYFSTCGRPWLPYHWYSGQVGNRHAA